MKKLILMTCVLLAAAIGIHAQEIFDAVRSGDLAKVKELVEKDPQLVEARNANQSTPLHVAVDVDNELIVRYLIEKEADPNAVNRSNVTPLFYAKKVEIAKLLIEKGADINAQNSSFITPLLTASSQGRFEIVKLLIERGVDIHWESPNGSQTALSFALWFKQNNIADYLIDQGATIKSPDTQNGRTVLINALKAGNVKYIDKSREQGLSPFMEVETKSSLLHYAAESDSVELLHRLIDLGEPVNKKNICGWTPLHIAAFYGKKQSVEVFIQNGVDLKAKTADGKTAYNLAMESKHIELADFLVLSGADRSGPSFPELKGEYLGQPKPGKNAKIFAPGIVVAQYIVHSAITFSPDGNEAYWSEWGPGISCSKRIDGKWTMPVKYSDGDVPFISPDGKKFYFVAYKQVPEGRKEVIYVRNKTVSGWSEPEELSETINSVPGIHWGVSVDNIGNIYFGAHQNGACIFSSEYKDGKYTEPKIIESLRDVRAHSPYIAPDGSYLIISTLWEDGLKILFKKKDGTWTNRIDISNYIGFKGANYSIVTPDGKYLFLSRFLDDKTIPYWMDASFIEDLRKEALKDDK